MLCSEQNVSGHHEFGVVRGGERSDQELRRSAVRAWTVQELQHQRHNGRHEPGLGLAVDRGQRGHPHAAQRIRAGHQQVAHQLGRAADGHDHAGQIGQRVAVAVHVRGGRGHGVHVAIAVAQPVFQLVAEQQRSVLV